ncbi:MULTISPECIES: YafY family protein [Chryseobacterium group]|uniref:helix-turn-helix transcriptional regulator n=1 Tax=Chryseobacterium group TaxID=2782232 RepID=UPI001C44D9A9|nr:MULTISPECIES: WYL domain-containing protein [Chryseobacterium]MCP2037369.1 putative DNA-binding transcriptional regulator YafY [Chryseobacterium sp. HSC-36S06]UFK96797.1 WYL domain-containing protein [Chryseobacterium faecale]
MSKKSRNLLRIYNRLKRGPVNIEVIKQWAKSHDLNISERTLYRYLDELEDIVQHNEKLIITEGEKNKKTWKIEYDKSSAKLNEFDIQSYLLFKNLMPLPLVKSREETFDRIENLFYKNYSKSNFEDFSVFADQQIANSYFYELLSLDGYQKTLNDAIWSIQHKREMRLLEVGYDYTSIPQAIAYPVDFLPLQILYHRGVIHLLGFVKGKNKIIAIALNQLKKYSLTNNMFDNRDLLATLSREMENRFGITNNMDDEIYDIEIEFSELTAEFVKHHFWHHSQNFSKIDNGNYVMTLRCGINRELVGWIFQWMSNARVIKPTVLKQLVKEKHQEILDHYQSETPLTSSNSFMNLQVLDKN